MAPHRRSSSSPGIERVSNCWPTSPAAAAPRTSRRCGRSRTVPPPRASPRTRGQRSGTSITPVPHRLPSPCSGTTAPEPACGSPERIMSGRTVPPGDRKIAFGPMVERLDPLLSRPPAFGEEAARQVLRDAFGLEASLTGLAGERDENFRADTADGRLYLLKISNPADDRPVIEMQVAALRQVEQVDPGLPVMRALPSAAGQGWVEVPGPDGRIYPVRLFTFLPGRVTPVTALSAPAIRSFGQTTARLGRALRGFFHPAADYEILWDIKHALKLRPLLAHLADHERRVQAERVLDQFEARAAPVLPGLRAQVIHGDMSLDNVLLGDDLRISGIVDFGDMVHAPLVCDLAVAVADVLHGRPDPIEMAEMMIGGYASVTPLEDEEADLLADLVAARLATEVVITA